MKKQIFIEKLKDNFDFITQIFSNYIDFSDKKVLIENIESTCDQLKEKLVDYVKNN